MTEPSLAVFIDNSNLWIEGKKAYATHRDLSEDEHPSWRLKMGSLIKIIKGNREFAQNP